MADQFSEAVDSAFRALVDGGLAPGVAFGVVSREGLIHSGGHGVAWEDGPCPDATTAFRIASMTKSFTAAAVLLLEQRGALSLADPVSRYVSEFGAVRRPTSDSPAVTVGMLLSMSGGLPTDDPWADRQESMDRVTFGKLLAEGIRFVAPPGTGFEYSNLGYVLLGQVIENVSGATYHEFVTRELLEPLGLKSTGFDRSVPAPSGVATGHVRLDGRWQAVPFAGPGVFSALGGLFSTVADVARWVSWLAEAFPARDAADAGPLSRAARRELQRVHRVIPSGHNPWSPGAIGGYGYGVIIESDPACGDVVWHSGGYPGFGSHMRWHPETGLGVIVLTNARYVTGRANAATALRTVLDSAPPAPTREFWPETLAARAAVERLFRGWDTGLIEDWFADNVELDLDWPHRRAGIEALLDAVGPLLEPTSPTKWLRSNSAAHVVWRVPGERGSLRCEILLTPQDPPKIQTFTVTMDQGDTP